MGWTTGIATYVVVWWLVIFMVLPWGNRALDESDIAKGHASGAPKRPHLWLKAAVTTVVSGVLWLIIWAVIEYGGISFRQ